MKNAGRTVFIIILAVLLLSPVDLAPDFIPVLGWTDDLIYIIAIIHQALQMREEAVIVDRFED